MISKNIVRYGVISILIFACSSIVANALPLQENEAAANYNEATRLYEAMLKINQGHFYFTKYRYEDALAEYNAVLSDYGDQAEPCAIAQTYSGIAWYQLGNYEDALEAFKTVLNIYENHEQLCAQSLAGISEIYRITGRYEEARMALQELKTKYPDSLQAQVMANIIEVLPMESEQDDMGQVTGIEESAVIVQEFLSGRISQENFEYLLVAIDEKNENDVLYVIGLKYQMTGNMDAAQKYYQKCIDISVEKGDKDAAYNMALKALENLRAR